MNSRGKVTVIMDGQAGSCGKGKVIGYIATHSAKRILAINNFMSNAGHTFVQDDGTKIMTQHLPSSMMNKDAILCIGPGAAITPHILLDEIKKYRDIIGDRYIHIHPRAAVILSRHAKKEMEIIRSGSTFKGCGVAQAEKIMRMEDVILFRDWYKVASKPSTAPDREDDEWAISKINVTDTGFVVNKAINEGVDVIIEGSQGFDLDINYGLDYPHTTSRQCNAGQLVADCGISPRLVDEVVMVIRPYPIRISNDTNIGLQISSGDYANSDELTWDIIRSRCGAPDDVQFGEMTTVTKKMRRVFEMNWDRLKYAVMINRPTAIALNFAQYIDYDVLGAKDEIDMFLSDKLNEFISKICTVTGVPVKYIGTGATNSDMVQLYDGGR